MSNDTGRVITNQENTVWLRKAGSFDAAEWGGSCMMIEDINAPGKPRNPTYCQDAREGGVKITGSLPGLPPLATTQLVAKETQYDTLIDDMENSGDGECKWDIDRRTHCKNLDDWDAWEKIRRVCNASITGVTHTGSDTGTGDATESMVTIPLTGENTVTIRKNISVSVQQDVDAIGISAAILDVSVCHGERCGSRCDSENNCVIAAVTAIDTNPRLLINNNGGAAGYWTNYSLTEWATDDAIAVICLGDFVFIASEGADATDGEFLRSTDGGSTRTELAGSTDMTAGNYVTQMASVIQTRIVACGQNGYLYLTEDQGSSWITTDAAQATTENYTRIKIAMDDTDIVYAIGENNAMAKSVDGGYTWTSVTGPSLNDDLTALYVKDVNNLLVGNHDGELYESRDGGTTWVLQDPLPDIDPLDAGLVVIQDIVGCECNVLWLIVKDTSVASFAADTEQRVYRNVEGGASGKWTIPTGGDFLGGLTTSQFPEAIACCGVNRAVVVGGRTAANNFAAVVS